MLYFSFYFTSKSKSICTFEKFRGESIFLPLTTRRTIFRQASLFYFLNSTNYKSFSQNLLTFAKKVFFVKGYFDLLYLYGKRMYKACKKDKIIPGKNLENLEKSWKYHGILSVSGSGNPEFRLCCQLNLALALALRPVLQY